MSSKRISPTANLIRGSRLMAVPAPRGHSLGDSQYFRPPYPTHQAITTPESSRGRGDWGLKRPLPRKTNSAYIRYNDVDTIEHRTTFESAHDTVMTVKKWQEMGIPLKLQTKTQGQFVSAFHTQPHSHSSQASSLETEGNRSAGGRPWGYREKSILQMTRGELQSYITTKLIPRRAEFNAYVGSNSRVRLAESTDASLEVEAAGNGNVGRPVQHDVPSPASEDAKTLRHDIVKARAYIPGFLQIPLREVPLPLHPSGGLHYVLDASYLKNDPVRGPGLRQTVPARLINRLDGRQTETIRTKRPIYIVGGIVLNAQSSSVPEYSHEVSFIQNVSPISAELDQRGKITIEMERIFAREGYSRMLDSSAQIVQRRPRVKGMEGHDQNMALKPGAPPTDRRGKSPEGKTELNVRLMTLLDTLGELGPATRG